jgi:hypothetical protein
MNLVELIKDQLSGETIGKLSSVLGESESKVGATVAAAVPSLLSALSGLVSTKGGAEKVVNALRHPDLSGLDDPGSVLRGGSPAAVQVKGEGLLESILGGGGLSTIANALAKFTGSSSETVKSLLAYLMPVVLGTIAGQFKNRALTPQGLTGLFHEQKANIANAMPAGLSLGNVGLRHEMASPEAGVPNWLWPAAAIALLALAGWYYFNREPPKAVAVNKEPQAENPQPPAEPAQPSVVETSKIVQATAPNLDDVKKDVDEVYSSATRYLEDIKDKETAETALPKLEGLNEKLDQIKKAWDKLPTDVRSKATVVTNESLAKLKQVSAKVLAIPGVPEKLKTAVDSLLDKLTAWS